jgi:hypothetical protein
MGKRSGVPHRDEEIAQLSDKEIREEIQRAKVRLTIPQAARSTK